MFIESTSFLQSALGAIKALLHLIVITIQWTTECYLHLAEEETEAQRVWVI